MTEGRLNELFGKFSKVDESAERLQISYLIFGRIAAGMENHERDAEKIDASMSKMWLEAADRFDRVLREDPSKAFEMALQVTLLPVSADPKIEGINKWIRSDGPSMLGREELRGNLLEYLKNGEKSKELAQRLGEYVSLDFSKINDRETAFERPDCYLSLSTILLGLKMGKDVDSSENVRSLFERAELKFRDPEVTRVINYYQELEDTKWLADELNSFKVK
jgi:hypothetical protein